MDALSFALEFKDSAQPDSFKRQLAMAGQVDDMDTIPDAPELSSSLMYFYKAFFDLCTTRHNGMGIGVISWLSVRQYADYEQLDSFGVHFLHRTVKALDPIYVEHLVNESKKNQKR